MNKMIIASLAVLAFGCASQANNNRVPSSSKKNGSFSCSNAPAVTWGTYHCVSGSFKGSHHLTDVVFGTCEGSSKAEEEEPVEQVNISSLKHDSNLAATSSEWKDASAFDVTTKELGEATLYLQENLFEGTGTERAQARLKIKVDGKVKDVRMTCGSSLDK